MKPADERDYREFVAARMEVLRRTAFLLRRDWHTADDLVSITLGKLYRHWRRVRAADNPDAYARGVLTDAWLDELRRPWRREQPTAELPEPPPPVPAGEATTRLLGISEGAVKSQAARGLAALRLLAVRPVTEERS